MNQIHEETTPMFPISQSFEPSKIQNLKEKIRRKKSKNTGDLKIRINISQIDSQGSRSPDNEFIIIDKGNKGEKSLVISESPSPDVSRDQLLKSPEKHNQSDIEDGKITMGPEQLNIVGQYIN